MTTAPCAVLCVECDHWDDKEGNCWIGYVDYSTCPVAHEFDEDVE